ncbi:hypothetical protein KAT21_05465 [Candidatus Bathyarchaeota archaeon]|nr:hypothetical protein [Candidatus Bathyarchaeota archaeon]
MSEEKWLCNWLECANGAGLASRGECIADPYRIFRYLSNCPEFEPIKFENLPDIEYLPF